MKIEKVEEKNKKRDNQSIERSRDLKELLELLGKAIEERSYFVGELSNILKIKIQLEELEAKKMNAVSEEDYENAIIYRDNQKLLRKNLKNYSKIEDIKNDFRHNRQLKRGSSFNNQAINDAYRSILGEVNEKGGEILSFENFEKIAFKSKLITSLFSKASRFVQDQMFQSLDIESCMKMINQVKKQTSNFEKKIEKISSETPHFCRIVFESERFQTFTRFYYLANTCILSLGFTIHAQIEEKRDPKKIEKISNLISSTSKQCLNATLALERALEQSQVDEDTKSIYSWLIESEGIDNRFKLNFDSNKQHMLNLFNVIL